MDKEKKANDAHNESAIEILMQHKEGLFLARRGVTQKWLNERLPEGTFRMLEGVIRLEVFLEDKKMEEKTGISPAISARFETLLPSLRTLVKRSKGTALLMTDMALSVFKVSDYKLQEQ
ncbi:MAG: hypothetical protein ABSD68_00570 [Candidatus Micrarchaeales archaeon]|jgi:hypothetical protein